MINYKKTYVSIPFYGEEVEIEVEVTAELVDNGIGSYEYGGNEGTDTRREWEVISVDIDSAYESSRTEIEKQVNQQIDKSLLTFNDE